VSAVRGLRVLAGACVVFAAGCAAPRRQPPDRAADAPRGEAPPARTAAEAAPVAEERPAPPPTLPRAEGVFARVGERRFTGDDVAREFFRAFREQAFAALNRMVVNEIVRQEAEKSGMSPPEEWLVREREKAFQQLGAEAVAAYGKGTDVALFLERAFKETPAAWAKRKERDLRDQWLRDRVVRLHGLRRECAEIQLLVVRDEALAREIAGKLDQGADFAALAAAHSVHESAASGGRLPPLARESLNPALADRAFTLPVGTRSGILAVDDGAGGRQFNLLRVVRRLPGRSEGWAGLAAEIEAGLLKEPVSRFEFVAWQLAAFSLYNVAVDDTL
jgi:foldase protein PrsA